MTHSPLLHSDQTLFCDPDVFEFTDRLSDSTKLLYALTAQRKIMKVSGWSNSTPNNRTGAGHGVRIHYDDRDRYFRRNRGSVEIEFDDGEVIDVSLPETFWTTCPELKSSVIGRWMLKQGVIPWAKGKPPEFDLEPVGDRRFRLARS